MKSADLRVCWSNGQSGFEKIELLQHTDLSFNLVYGKSVKVNLDYWSASRELGAAIMHLAACNGDLDNRGE